MSKFTDEFIEQYRRRYPSLELPKSPVRVRFTRDMNLAGFTAGTQKNYIRIVVALQEHFGVRPDRLSEEQIYKYVSWLLEDKKVAKGTFQVYFSAMKFFYHCSLGYDWKLFTRMKVRKPRQSRLPVALSPENCNCLLTNIRQPLFRLCCSSMYSLGLRLCEAITLSVTAIDAGQMVVRIIGKGNKERVVPLTQSLLAELRRLWKTHQHPVWIFPNTKGSNHLCRKSLYRAFASARDIAGLPASGGGSFFAA